MACLFHSRFCVASLFLSCLSGNAAAHQHQWHAPAAPEGRPEAARPAERSAPARPAEKSAPAKPAEKSAPAKPAERSAPARPADERSAPAAPRPEAATAEAYRPEPFLFSFFAKNFKKNTRILNMKIL